jgi:sugar phosphate isomerase/epimerase
MKLCVSTYSLARWRNENNKTLEDSIDWIADAGVPAIEFSGLDAKAAENPLKRARELRKRCERRGLHLAGYSVGANLLCNPTEQRKMIERVKLDVDTAAELGAKNMRHDVAYGFNDANKDLKGPKTFAHALKVVVPAIREITEHGAKRGVKTSLENHGFFMQASDRVERLIKAVGHKNYGLTLDMGNFLCVNEDPVKAVARVAKYAIMVHTKDFHVKSKATRPPTGWFDTPTEIALRGAIVGHGVIDVPQQLALVKKAGYKGYLSLEFEGMEEPAMAIKTGLDYLTRELKAIRALS